MKQKDLLFIVISSAILVVIWITFNIIHTSLTSTITETVGQELNAIPRTFDTKTLDALKKRQQVTPITVITVIPSVIPSPTPPPVTPVAPVSNATSSATPTPQGGTQ